MLQISGMVLNRTMPTASSRRSFPPNRGGLEWDCPSAVRLSKPMAVVCRPGPELPKERFLNSLCQTQTLPMNDSRSVVFVIEDDASMRDALKRLIRSVHLEVELFGSA